MSVLIHYVIEEYQTKMVGVGYHFYVVRVKTCLTMCVPLTPEEDAVYHEYLRRFTKGGEFNGDIADQTTQSCNMSYQRAQVAVLGLFKKGKISLIKNQGDEENRKKIDCD